MVYGALWYGVFALFTEFPAAWPYWIFVLIALVSALAGHYHGADKALLKSVGADLVDPGAEPQLEATLARLAALADVPAPRLALAGTDAANAFAVGLSQRGAAVVVTSGLRRRLDNTELEAVLGHEMSHIANRDAAVLTAVAAPRILGEVMVGGASSPIGLGWYLIWPLGIPIYMVGTLLTLTVSRYREFAADRGSAILTGAPEQLMSALRKLATDAAEIPHDDLRAANAFCIVPTEASLIELFSDHPPTEKRLAVLAEIAREMGHPAA